MVSKKSDILSAGSMVMFLETRFKGPKHHRCSASFQFENVGSCSVSYPFGKTTRHKANKMEVIVTVLLLLSFQKMATNRSPVIWHYFGLGFSFSICLILLEGCYKRVPSDLGQRWAPLIPDQRTKQLVKWQVSLKGNNRTKSKEENHQVAPVAQ